MGKLIYVALSSLDGYIADEHGKFDWAEPDAEVHSFANDLTRGLDTFLYGRRLYEVMTVWDHFDLSDVPTYIGEFARIWRGADKVVYSTTLESVSTARTRLETVFDPEAVRAMKAASSGDLSVGGANLASTAFLNGLVDECQLLLAPAIIGGGTRTLPDKVRLDLDLLDERRFESGFVYLRYSVRN